ncbi:MAG: homocysteine S-methyltransferase family protein, partial [Treponema porcinum]|uniref:homocysteine S-methyltransferase family protein n=1 Tax=Treponema porcinum TaxID=261392 RepID=UPI002352B7F3
MTSLKSLLGKQILFFDGGTGSVLQARGLKPGEFPEKWNVTRPEEIISLHYNYFSAGSNIVNTNTFGAFSTKFSDLTTDEKNCNGTQNAKNSAMRVISGENADFSLKNIIQCAIENANEARRRYISDCKTRSVEPQPCFITFDIGPTGKLLKPMGDLDFEDAVSLFKQTFRYGFKGNIDAVLIETMSDSYETKAAVIAAKEVREETGRADLPIFVSNAYDATGHLLTGASPEVMAALLEGLGVDALGLNCSLGPEQMKETVRRLTAVSSTPVIVKPNAGLPHDENGSTVFDVKPHDFALSMQEIAKSGAVILGGCCGTTPEYIKSLTENLKNTKPAAVLPKERTVISSYTHTVQIGGENVPVLIGERINPTGKKKFKEALRNGDIPYIVHQGLEQEA